MALTAAQHTDNSAEARRATLEQFAQLPEDKQKEFLQNTYAQPHLQTNPDLLHAAMKDTIQQHLTVQRGPTLELAAMLQLSPQLAPTGIEKEHKEELVASVSTAQAEVKQALQRGESVESIKAKALSTDNSVQAAVVNTVAQEHQQEQKLNEMAANREQDQKYRVEKGLAEPEKTPDNALAAALAGHAGLISSFHQSLGGHAQDLNQGASQQAVAKVSEPTQDTGRGGRG